MTTAPTRLVRVGVDFATKRHRSQPCRLSWPSMGQDWTTEHVLTLAPDASSAKSGRGLAVTSKWPTLGRDDRSAWGECKGSGKKPYQTRIDLSEPAFKCSCPSRKFPCKHAIGLFLLLAEQPALFQPSVPPDWVSEWLASRDDRAEQREQRAEAKKACEADPVRQGEARGEAG